MALSIKAEELFHIGELTVTNSMLSAFIIVIVLITFYAIYTKKLNLIPSSFQLFLEWIIESIYSLVHNVLGQHKAKRVFPIIFSLFSLIIISNWFGLLPTTGSIGIAEKSYKEGGSLGQLIVFNIGQSKEEIHESDIAEENKKFHYELIPFFRSPSADLNFTIALAIIAFVLIQYNAIKEGGLHYLGKFFDYRVSIPTGWKVALVPFAFLINFLWKTLELVLEFSKILSFSFRLFGNIFAGEVLLVVITSLSLGIITLPFLGFELFVGFIQSIVFIFLTMVFIRVSLDTH
ncbi:MAG: ATP synthase subunit a [Candidatus Dojkabacteria bacterium]|nr:MAG: ATP synthase subunit a [Candidatus Dojkabacteria bacterium]